MNGHPNDCGCCAGLSAQTPADVANRPGLTAIAYRVGTHPTFKSSMLAALSDFTRPALVGLKTREDDDFSIALLDASAMLADVLTFYQERIANESYLRTATERRSLLELARLIGYELRPGVAAHTYLVFTLDDAPGAPTRTTIDIGLKVQSIPGPDEIPRTFETVEKIEARVEWNAMKPPMTQVAIPVFGATHIYVKGAATNLKAGDAILFVGGEREQDAGSERWDFRRVAAVILDHNADRTRIEWLDGLGTTSPHVVLPAASSKLYALRQRAALFGYNAPHPLTLSKDTRENYGFANPNDHRDWTFGFAGPTTIDLDTTYPGILKNSWIVLSRPDYQELYRATAVTEGSQAQYTLAGKTTRVTLDTSENLTLFQAEHYRETMAFAQSERLDMAEEPIATAMTGRSVTLTPKVNGLAKGQVVVALGKDDVSGDSLSEVVTIADMVTAGNTTTLVVTPPLANRYARDSFRINANVALATHGETVQDVLGSGEAGRAYQRFTLRQPPLTFVGASTPSGSESTLRIRVNDLLWHEVATLYGRGPQEHIFITRSDDDGKTTVQFGDGITGARLPSGQDNVRAVYRKGNGLGGLVKAEQLSLLLTRPLGVKAVINPKAAAGADDPESLDDARRNAPLTVLTLDRAVSLQDYEDFASAFGGIAKALSTWTWDKQTRRVLLTVAGPNGLPVDPTTSDYLLKALQAAGDPFVNVQVKSYRPAFFKLAGTLIVSQDALPDKVLTAVEQVLRTQFSFDARAFGQPVMLSEVIAAIQNVAGVVAVDLDKLHRADVLPTLQSRLLAALPETGGDGDVASAELLTLDPAPLDQLGAMS
jgi:predicted phage baseplate assembly protein